MEICIDIIGGYGGLIYTYIIASFIGSIITLVTLEIIKSLKKEKSK